MQRSFAIASILLACCWSNTAAAQAIDKTNVFGTWTTEEMEVITIERCGDSVCGKIKWTPLFDENVRLDERNSDKSLRSRELLGLTVLSEFQRTRNGWRKGKIYDPVAGRSFRSKLERIDAQTLKVTGCWAFLCQSFFWKSRRSS